MTLTATVNGRQLSDIATHSPIVYETLADGGLGTASFNIRATGRMAYANIRERMLVEVYESGVRVWFGRVQSVNRTDGGVICRGAWDDGRSQPALDGSGASTLNVGVAVPQAILRGWPVTAGGVTGTATGEPADPLSVVSLLELLAQEQGKRVGVDGSGRLYLRSDPVEPKWVIVPEGVELSGVDLDRPNAVAGRYIHSPSGVLTTITRPSPLPAHTVMTTYYLSEKRGKLTTEQASALLYTALARVEQRPMWTNGLTLHRSQIQTTGGVSPSVFANVKAGDMVRIRSLSAAQQEQVGAPYLDVILGKVVITDDSDAVYVEPVGVTPQTFEDAMEVRSA